MRGRHQAATSPHAYTPGVAVRPHASTSTALADAADPDDDHDRPRARPIAQAQRRASSVRARRSLRRRRRAAGRRRRRVARGEQPPDLGAEHALERRGRRLDDGHRPDLPRERRRDLGADEAGADDDQPARLGRGRPAAPRVVERAQVVDARAGPASRRARTPVASTSASQAIVLVADRCAVAPARVDRRSTRRPSRSSIPCSAQNAVADAGATSVALAGEQLLGERGPLVGRVRLVADEHDAAARSRPRAASRRSARRRARRRRSRTRPGHAACTCLDDDDRAHRARGGGVERGRVVGLGHDGGAMPPSSSWNRARARASTQAPKPLQSDRSIAMRYLLIDVSPFGIAAAGG